jgi:hypothetical protein
LIFLYQTSRRFKLAQFFRSTDEVQLALINVV